MCGGLKVSFKIFTWRENYEYICEVNVNVTLVYWSSLTKLSVSEMLNFSMFLCTNIDLNKLGNNHLWLIGVTAKWLVLLFSTYMNWVSGFVMMRQCGCCCKDYVPSQTPTPHVFYDFSLYCYWDVKPYSLISSDANFTVWGVAHFMSVLYTYHCVRVNIRSTFGLLLSVWGFNMVVFCGAFTVLMRWAGSLKVQPILTHTVDWRKWWPIWKTCLFHCWYKQHSLLHWILKISSVTLYIDNIVHFIEKLSRAKGRIHIKGEFIFVFIAVIDSFGINVFDYAWYCQFQFSILAFSKSLISWFLCSCRRMELNCFLKEFHSLYYLLSL